MSDQAYVAASVAGTFVAVLLAGMMFVTVSRSRRSAHVLKSNLESAGVTVGQGGAAGSMSERIIDDAITGFSRWASRVTPAALRRGVSRRLLLAGSPSRWTADAFVGAQIAITIGFGVLGYLIGMTGTPHTLGPFWIPLLAFAAYVAPLAALDRKAQKRQEQIRRMLADTTDMLTISVEAGLAFDAALLHARRSMKGPLSEEIGRMLHEMQLGIKRSDAMRNLADRTNVPELRSFVLAMVQADVFGVSVANVLRAQSQELRTKRRQRAEERAMKTPVKLLFPMTICILPALLVLVIGPAAIRITHVLF